MRFLFIAVALGLSLSAPQKVNAERISYGEIEAFRSLNMLIRFSNCSSSKCERHVPASDVSPEQFMKADTVDFSGYRLLQLPDWLFSMPNLKSLRLTNSVLEWDDFRKLSSLTDLEIIDLSNVEVKGMLSNNDANGNAGISDIFAPMSNLAHLNLSNITFDNRRLPSSTPFLKSSTSSNLISLNVYCDSCRDAILNYLPFSNLESLTGHIDSRFDPNYQDAFSFPKLVKLSGFHRGVTADYVHDRVYARMKNQGLNPDNIPEIGITAKYLTPKRKSELGISQNAYEVTILDGVADSAFNNGDIIFGINGNGQYKKVTQLFRDIENYKAQNKSLIRFYVLREGNYL